jgi:hypothetical protein
MSDSETETEVFIRQIMNRFRGKMAGFVEALGLNERQERSIISTIKSLSYDVERSLVDELDQ